MGKPSFQSWKPRKEGGGAAAIFNYNQESNSIYLGMLPQVGTELRKFDDKKRLNVKIGLADIGEMLLVLNGGKDGCGAKDGENWKGLYHKNPSGSSIIGFSVGKNGYNLSVSVDRDGNKSRLSVTLAPWEGELLRLFLQRYAVELMMDSFEPSPVGAEAE